MTQEYRIESDRYARHSEPVTMQQFEEMCSELGWEIPDLREVDGAYYDGDELVLEPVIRCECGAITGQRCEHLDATVEVRWVPPHLRETARAAGGDMIRPYADRLTLSPACAEAWAETEGEWFEQV